MLNPNASAEIADRKWIEYDFKYKVNVVLILDISEIFFVQSMLAKRPRPDWLKTTIEQIKRISVF